MNFTHIAPPKNARLLSQYTVILSSYNTVFDFNGYTNFINHSADNEGGALYTLEGTKRSLNATTNFIGNSTENNVVQFAHMNLH